MTDITSTTTSAKTAGLVRFLTVFWLSLRVHWPFFAFGLLYALVTYVLLAPIPKYAQVSMNGLFLGWLVFGLPAGIVAVVLFKLLVHYPAVVKPDSPSKQMLFDVKNLFVNFNWLVLGLPMLLANFLFNKGMVELKPMIPVLKPFVWDEAFMQLDRQLHLGTDPWILLQPILGHDWVIFLVGVAYNFWFLTLFGFAFWFGFARRNTELRNQFFMAYMLTWFFGGGLAALYFSSAGPVFYSNLGLSPDPFAPLMSYLRDVDTRLPIWSLLTQDALWQGYTGTSQPIGISAFPSMHNASSMLFALAAWRLSRIAGIVFSFYALVIFCGSIQLGWHYAVDGYAAFAIAIVSWKLAGVFARWHGRQATTKQLDAALAGL